MTSEETEPLEPRRASKTRGSAPQRRLARTHDGFVKPKLAQSDSSTSPSLGEAPSPKEVIGTTSTTLSWPRPCLRESQHHDWAMLALVRLVREGNVSMPNLTPSDPERHVAGWASAVTSAVPGAVDGAVDGIGEFGVTVAVLR